MTNNKKMFSFIIILFILLAAITAGIVYFAYNITKFTPYGHNTEVGNVYIGGMIESDAKEVVENKISNWKEEATITLVYQGYEMELDKSKFELDLDKTFSKINDRQNNLEVTIVEENYLKNILNENESIIKFNDFNIGLLEQNLLTNISSLYKTIRVDIESYVNIDTAKTNFLKEISLNYNDDNFDDYQSNIEIFGNKQFSFLTMIKEKEISFTDEKLSVLSTGIYKLIIDTNFNNIQKYISLECPYYTTPGYEAMTSVEYNLDLSFYNPNGNSYFIMVNYDDINSQLKFRLYGAPFINSITHENDIEILQPSDVYWYGTEYNNIELEENEEIIIEAGKLGYRHRIYRIINNQSKILLKEDIYMPTYNLIIKNDSSKLQ